MMWMRFAYAHPFASRVATPLAGVEFRLTDGYIATLPDDVTNHNDAYPQTKMSASGKVITCGWFEPIDGAMDLDNTVDARLAGLDSIANGGVTKRWYYDLPDGPGTYDLTLALGAMVYPSWQRAVIYDEDETTVLATIQSVVTLNPGQFLDARGTVLSAAEWPTLNRPVSLTVAGTRLVMRLGDPTGTGDSSVAYFQVTDTTRR